MSQYCTAVVLSSLLPVDFKLQNNFINGKRFFIYDAGLFEYAD